MRKTVVTEGLWRDTPGRKTKRLNYVVSILVATKMSQEHSEH